MEYVQVRIPILEVMPLRHAEVDSTLEFDALSRDGKLVAKEGTQYLEQLIQRTEELEKQIDELIRELKRMFYGRTSDEQSLRSTMKTMSAKLEVENRSFKLVQNPLRNFNIFSPMN